MRLTVHRAVEISIAGVTVERVVEAREENYYITVTNASPTRDIVVTHIWIETMPAVQVIDGELPRRLRYSDVWETKVPVSEVPEDSTGVEWLGRCVIAPDDTVIKSRPRRNIPPAGTVPRRGG